MVGYFSFFDCLLGAESGSVIESECKGTGTQERALRKSVKVGEAKSDEDLGGISWNGWQGEEIREMIVFAHLW